jgi:hypothetical protein
MIGRINIKNLKNIKNHEKKPKEGMHNYAPCSSSFQQFAMKPL